MKNMFISNYSLLKITVLWCFFCSFILGVFYMLFPLNINLLFLKDFTLLGVFVLSLKFSSKVNVVVFLALFFLFFLVFQTFLTDSAPFAIASSVRQMIAPYMLFFIGYNLMTTDTYVSFKKFVIVVGLFIAIFGFIEILFEIWHYINLTNYFNIKNVKVYNLSYPKRYNYPPFFIEPLNGGIKRMTSTILDPINLGHTLTFMVSLLIFDKDLKELKWRRLFIFLLLIALFLTFCKGAMLQLAILTFIVSKVFSFNIKVLIIVAMTFLLYYMANFHYGIYVHLKGVEESFNVMSFLGEGLAKIGNQAFLNGEQTSKVGDTYFGAIVGQIGVIGYFLWIIPFIIVMKKLKFNLISKIFISQLLISIISENSFNLLSVFLVCIFLGIEYKKYQYNVEE